MCGRVRLSSDVSEIKLVLSIPPHRPIPNIAPSWNVDQRKSSGDRREAGLPRIISAAALPRPRAPDLWPSRTVL